MLMRGCDADPLRLDITVFCASVWGVVTPT